MIAGRVVLEVRRCREDGELREAQRHADGHEDRRDGDAAARPATRISGGCVGVVTVVMGVVGHDGPLRFFTPDCDRWHRTLTGFGRSRGSRASERARWVTASGDFHPALKLDAKDVTTPTGKVGDRFSAATHLQERGDSVMPQGFPWGWLLVCEMRQSLRPLVSSGMSYSCSSGVALVTRLSALPPASSPWQRFTASTARMSMSKFAGASVQIAST